MRLSLYTETTSGSGSELTIMERVHYRVGAFTGINLLTTKWQMRKQSHCKFTADWARKTGALGDAGIHLKHSAQARYASRARYRHRHWPGLPSPVGVECGSYPRGPGEALRRAGHPHWLAERQNKPNLLGNPAARLHDPIEDDRDRRKHDTHGPLTRNSRDINGRGSKTRHWPNFRSPRGAQSRAGQDSTWDRRRLRHPVPQHLNRAGQPSRELSPGHVPQTSGSGTVFVSTHPVDGDGGCVAESRASVTSDSRARRQAPGWRKRTETGAGQDRRRRGLLAQWCFFPRLAAFSPSCPFCPATQTASPAHQESSAHTSPSS